MTGQPKVCDADDGLAAKFEAIFESPADEEIDVRVGQ